MTVDMGTWDGNDPRCAVCMGPAGDDAQRCERPALPLHRTHLVDGVYWLPTNTDELNRALAGAYGAWMAGHG